MQGLASCVYSLFMNETPCNALAGPWSKAPCEIVSAHTEHKHTFRDANGRVECVKTWTAKTEEN